MTRNHEHRLARTHARVTTAIACACSFAVFAATPAAAQVTASAPSIDALGATSAEMMIASRQASATSQPHAFAVRPFAMFGLSAQRLRDSLVSLARAQVGRRYRTGGQSPA